MTTALPTELSADEVDRGGFEPPTRGFPVEVSLVYASLYKLTYLDSNQEPAH